MDQPKPAADSRADAPIMTSEDTVTRDTVEAAATPAPENHGKANPVDRPERPPLRNAEAAADAAADVARRIVAEERARIAGIYDAVRKLGLDPTVADVLVRDGVPLDLARGRLIDHAAERDDDPEERKLAHRTRSICWSDRSHQPV